MFTLLFSLALATEIVTFRIPAGTGQGPWNTEDAVVEVKVGQTLRIINDDDTPHLLHTSGAPCAHGDDEFKKGEHYDCVITKVADPKVDRCWDHNFGPKSRFYVRATN